MNLTELKLPTDLKCPNCGYPITNASATRSAPKAQFIKGSVVICSKCLIVSRFGPMGLERMSPQQINALSPQSKEAIMATKLVLARILDKNKSAIDIKSR